MAVDKRSLPTVESLRPVARTVVAVAREKQLTLMAASSPTTSSARSFRCSSFRSSATRCSATRRSRRCCARPRGRSFRAASRCPEACSNTNGRLRAAALGALILAWSGLRTFGALDDAFAAVYDEREAVSLTEKVRDATVVLLTVALATAALAGGGVALAFALGDRLVLRLVSPLFLLVTLVAVFAPMYYVLPEVDGVSMREVLPGTLLAALVWTVSGVFFRLYATTSSSVHLYGVAGGLLLVLTWLYVGGLALLVGAALNAALAGRVDPDAEWVPTEYL